MPPVIRSWAAPVDSRSSPSRSRYRAAAASSSAWRRACAESSSRARVRAPSSSAGSVATRLATVAGEFLQLGDLPLPLDPRRVFGGQRADQPPDPIADLEGEVGGGGAGQRPHVLDRHLVLGREQLGSLRLAHGFPRGPIFASSARSSIAACWLTLIASWSPITHTWL